MHLKVPRRTGDAHFCDKDGRMSANAEHFSQQC